MWLWLCKLDFHKFIIIGWTYFGNPVEKCTRCGQAAVTYGSIMPQRTYISEEEVKELVQTWEV